MDNKKRGRPRKEVEAVALIKKERGRPRKHEIIEHDIEEILVGDRMYIAKHPKVSKVDSDHLVRHLLNYFTKIILIHQEGAKQKGMTQPLFERLKHLDVQMTDICRELLD